MTSLQELDDDEAEEDGETILGLVEGENGETEKKGRSKVKQVRVLCGGIRNGVLTSP